MTNHNRHILIIGGAGYIGTVVTQHLLDSGYAVRCFDNLIYEHGLVVLPYLNHERYEFVHGDITDQDALIGALDGVTDVVLLAGLVGDPITKSYPDESHMINDCGYEVIFSVLSGRELDQVIFVSTCSNYGLIQGDYLAKEDHALKPLSLYAKSKVHIEEFLLDSQGKVDFSPTVLRFATAFGLSPRMRFDLTISEFTRTILSGEELLVYDAHTWRPYCHVRDFANVIYCVLNAPKAAVAFNVFNAGGEENNFTKKMIVDAILAELPEGRVRFQEQGSDPRNYRVDFTKINERLGFKPEFTVRDGIRELMTVFNKGLFHDISAPESFYGNWVIHYSPKKSDSLS